MIRFSYELLSDDRLQIKVQTPVTRVGTLNRLTAAIYVLGLNIVSGNVLTEEDEGGAPLTHDNFVLEFTDPENRNIHEATTRLGVLMETILQENLEPRKLLAEHNVAAPDPGRLFAGHHRVQLEDLPELSITRFYL